MPEIVSKAQARYLFSLAKREPGSVNIERLKNEVRGKKLPEKIKHSKDTIQRKRDKIKEMKNNG